MQDCQFLTRGETDSEGIGPEMDAGIIASALLDNICFKELNFKRFKDNPL